MNADLDTDPTNLRPGERLRLAIRTFRRGRKPGEKPSLERIQAVGEVLNAGHVARARDRMKLDPRGAKLLEERPNLDASTIDLDALAALPAGTLGHAFAHFIRWRNLSIDVFHAPRTIRDPEIAWLLQRGRQTHDLFHVATGIETDIAGEVILQAFTFGQTGAPQSRFITIAGTLRLLTRSASERGHPIGRRVREAYQLGKQTKSLMLFPWEKHWSTPLVEVRRALGLPDEGVPDLRSR